MGTNCSWRRQVPVMTRRSKLTRRSSCTAGRSSTRCRSATSADLMARSQLLSAQLTEAAQAYPGTCASALPDGTHVVEVPVQLPPGWSRTHTTIRFLVPVAFPAAQLDCFYADADLRLANGGMPMNSGMQPLNGVN